jgi:AcrR family transcriptional regulator
MRTRLNTAQRRAQLLDIGAKLFAQRSYDDVSMEEVAEIAGVSYGLPYHYFTSKRGFYLAIVDDESAKLLHASKPDPLLPPLAQLNAGLNVYIDYAASYPDGFRIAQGGAFTDNDLRDIHQARVLALRERILKALATVMTTDRATQIAVTAWLGFVTIAILDWLDDPTVTRDQLRDLCARAFLAAVNLPTETAFS